MLFKSTVKLITNKDRRRAADTLSGCWNKNMLQQPLRGLDGFSRSFLATKPPKMLVLCV